MIFTSYTYIAFLVCVFIVHWSLPSKFRKPLLVVASYVFYCSWQWQFGFLLLGISLFNWSYGRWVVARSSGRVLLTAGILVNLAPLFYFKYTGFLLTNVHDIVTLIGGEAGFRIPVIALPIGISFFTFQGVAYLVDVAAGDVPFHHPLDFLLYKALWPQLIAGPIIRPAEIREQIEGERQLTYSDAAYGARRVLLGIAKKVVLADMMADYVDLAFLPGASPGFVDAAVGTVGFSLQIYFDFSAYSDIAIGSALLFGFKFPENFNWPYLAQSPQEFWNRWHMTLSRWIRDYVFTPLSFSQRRRPKLQKWALVAAMAICGLWHGAKWTFVIWGVWHGVLLVVSKLLMKRHLQRGRAGSLEAGKRGRVRHVFSNLLTVTLVCVGWILFRAQDLKQAGTMFGALATGRGGLRPMLVRENGVLIVFGIFLVTALIHVVSAASPQLVKKLKEDSLAAKFVAPLAYALTIVAIIVFDKEAKAFVYFQF